MLNSPTIGSTAHTIETRLGALPKRSALWAAAARALGAHDRDPVVRNPDWLAEAFLGPHERQLLCDNPVLRALEDDYNNAPYEASSAARYMLQRTKFCDAHLIDAYAQG